MVLFVVTLNEVGTDAVLGPDLVKRWKSWTKVDPKSSKPTESFYITGF